MYIWINKYRKIKINIFYLYNWSCKLVNIAHFVIEYLITIGATSLQETQESVYMHMWHMHPSVWENPCVATWVPNPSSRTGTAFNYIDCRQFTAEFCVIHAESIHIEQPDSTGWSAECFQCYEYIISLCALFRLFK